MKRVAFGLAMLMMASASLAQSFDVSSQPVPGLFNSNDTRAAIKMAKTNRSLSEFVQKCYFNPAREYPIGSVNGYQAVAFCAEVDMAGAILNQHAAQSDAYFEISTAENRIGTELISFAGLNTYQAYQTNIWLKAIMTQLVAQANDASLSDADQAALDRSEKAAEAMHEATPGPEKEALLACTGVRPTKDYPIPSKSTCIKYLKTFNLDSSYYSPIPAS